MSEKLLPLLSSRIIMVSGLTFRSLIHFEFIFVYGIRKWSSFTLLHIAVQFSQHYFLKTLSFFHWILFPALSKITWPYICVQFWVLYSIPLVYVSVFVPIPYCLDDYSFVVFLEIWDYNTSSFALLFQNCFV